MLGYRDRDLCQGKAHDGCRDQGQNGQEERLGTHGEGEGVKALPACILTPAGLDCEG